MLLHITADHHNMFSFVTERLINSNSHYPGTFLVCLAHAWAGPGLARPTGCDCLDNDQLYKVLHTCCNRQAMLD